MKKRVFAIAVIVICLSILASTSLAYYTTKGTARNVITSDGVSIKVVEERLVNGKREPYPEKVRIPVMPTSEVSKIVTVKNLERDAWIRAKYIITVFDANGNPMNVNKDELEKVILIGPADKNWTKKGDWWYYSSALGTDASTTSLFETVAFSGPNMGNEYQGSTVKIQVIAEAVQKANNGITIDAAQGWAD